MAMKYPNRYEPFLMKNISLRRLRYILHSPDWRKPVISNLFMEMKQMENGELTIALQQPVAPSMKKNAGNGSL